MKHSLLLLACAMCFLGASAQAPKSAAKKDPVFTTVSGALKYRILKSTAKVRKPTTNMQVSLVSNYRLSIASNDSILMETFSADQPSYIPVAEPTTSKVLANLMAGDSVEMIINADTFFTKSFNQSRPPFVKAGDKIRFIIKVNEIITQQEIKKRAEKLTAEMAKQDSVNYAEAVKQVGATQKTAEGVYYKQVKKGNGTPVKKGDNVNVLYLGKLPNGNVFDQNLTNGIPLVVGANSVIQGWESMLANMEYGEKVIAVLPYKLAYGERGSGSSIPPFSTLIFEMEVLPK